MRISKCLVFVISLMSLAITFGCGGGGGGSDSGSSSTGTLSMSMTDAKPVLPAGITNCFVTIDEVSVHKSGGGWETLPMVQTPYTIDLLEFTEGATAEFVPPVAIESGKYTQVRLSVLSAKLWFNNSPNNEVEITIPSENLKTDKNFDFTVPVDEDGNEVENAAVNITIDFDLSKSIVVTGPAGNPSYMLKPVLHIVETENAATIEGYIANSEFAGNYVVITVFDSTGQEYTNVKVEKTTSDVNDKPVNYTFYEIFWLVPNQKYTVKICHDPTIDVDPVTDGTQYKYDEFAVVPSVPDQDHPDGTLNPGEIYSLDFPLPPTT